MLKDQQRAKMWGENGRKRVLKCFTWRKVAEQTLDIYKSLLAAGIEHKRPSPAKVGVHGDRIVDEDHVKQAWPIYFAYTKWNS